MCKVLFQTPAGRERQAQLSSAWRGQEIKVEITCFILCTTKRAINQDNTVSRAKQENHSHFLPYLPKKGVQSKRQQAVSLQDSTEWAITRQKLLQSTRQMSGSPGLVLFPRFICIPAAHHPQSKDQVLP